MKIPASQEGLGPIRPKQAVTLGGEESLEAKKLRLRKATDEFESFFVLHMLKAMRKTIPKSELTSGGLGSDMYTSMFDEELSRTMAGNSTNSLSDMLFRSMEKHLEATEAGPPPPGAPPTDIRTTPRIGTVVRSVPRTADPVKTEPESAPPAINVPAVQPRLSNHSVLNDYGRTIEQAAREHDIDPQLIYSVILAESAGRPDAVSHRGAKGLMQLMDETAAEMGVADSLNPHQNIMGGTKYLKKMLDTFDGNVKLAVAAYNAGPGAVSKYNGVPPYPETRQYVEKVLGRLHPVQNMR